VSVICLRRSRSDMASDDPFRVGSIFARIPWAALRLPTAIFEQPFRLPVSGGSRRFVTY